MEIDLKHCIANPYSETNSTVLNKSVLYVHKLVMSKAYNKINTSQLLICLPELDAGAGINSRRMQQHGFIL